MLERVKRWLRYFSKTKNLPVPPPRGGAFDPFCAWRCSEPVGTEGVTSPALSGGFDSPAARRTEGMTKKEKGAETAAPLPFSQLGRQARTSAFNGLRDAVPKPCFRGQPNRDQALRGGQ
jgi:hypothetical protein